MGDQVYAYRAAEYVSDRGNDCRTTVYDSDGRHRTVYGCPPPTQDGGTYVVKKTEVTQRVRNPSSYAYSINDHNPGLDHYRHGSSPPAGTYQYRRQTSPYDEHHQRRPQEVEEFLTGVQIEASHVKPYPAVAPARIGEYRKGRDGYSSDEYDDDDGYESDEYNDDNKYNDRRQRYHGGRPVMGVSSPKGYGTPARSTINHGKLGFPTTDIDEAVECLKLNNTTPRPYANVRTTVSETSLKPYGEVVGSRPYPTMYQTAEAVKPLYGTANNFNSNNYSTTAHHGSNYDNNGNYRQTSPKPYGGSMISGLSSEANSRPYGNNGYAGGTTTVTSSSTVIDCYEAARKYNGKVIRT